MGRSPMRDGAMGMGTSDQTSQLSLALGLYGFIAFTGKVGEALVVFSINSHEKKNWLKCK